MPSTAIPTTGANRILLDDKPLHSLQSALGSSDFLFLSFPPLSSPPPSFLSDFPLPEPPLPDPPPLSGPENQTLRPRLNLNPTKSVAKLPSLFSLPMS
ncbi:hypothetical protein TAEQ797_07930 [Taylorella equigenitalis]